MTVRARAGYTLIEALVALVVAGVLIVCLAGVLAAAGRAALRHADLAAAAETERTTMAVLEAELRTLTAGDATFSGDSVRLRAFRGGGVVCAAVGRDLLVAYRGARLPEPDKDSVVVIAAAAESVYDVANAAAGECDGEPALRLVTDATVLPASALYALVFETGAYSLAASAFRYRRGAAGRQPLTEENLAAASTLERSDRGAGAAIARVTLRMADARRAPPRIWSLYMPQGAMRAPTGSE